MIKDTGDTFLSAVTHSVSGDPVSCPEIYMYAHAYKIHRSCSRPPANRDLRQSVLSILSSSASIVSRDHRKFPSIADCASFLCQSYHHHKLLPLVSFHSSSLSLPTALYILPLAASIFFGITLFPLFSARSEFCRLSKSSSWISWLELCGLRSGFLAFGIAFRMSVLLFP